MSNLTVLVVLGIILGIGAMVGLIFLQVFLSKKKSKWLGLILPIVSFILSLVIVVSSFMFVSVNKTISTQLDNINESSQTVVLNDSQSEYEYGNLLSTIPVFLLWNIPTIVFLMIFISIRKQKKLENQIERMKIDDLG